MAAVAATGLDEPVSAPAPSVQVTKCENHNPTIEEVADEEDIIKRHETPLSNSVLEADDDPEPLIAPKPIAKTKPAPIISSQEEFPALNGSRAKTPIVASQWGSNMSTGTPATGTSATASGAATPTSTATTEAKRMEMHIPGQYSRQMMLAPQYMVPKSKMKRSIPEILKDVSRKTNTKVTTRGGANGSMWFTAVGPNASQTEKAMLDIADQIGAELTVAVTIPAADKGKIIGKGGSVIKGIQERTGVRITMPKDDISKAPEDDDNATVDISIKGNEFRTAAARDEILKLVGTVANTKVNQAVRSIPAELYPFLAGPDNSRTKDLESQFNDLRVHIPTQHTWTAQPVSQPAGDSGPLSFLQPSGNNPITLTGNREQVLKARKTLEDNAEALRRQLRSEQVQMNRSRFPFIIGEYGVPLAQFVANTGCTITFTDDENDETVTVIGPADRIEGATQLAEELAFDRFNSFTVDISKHHRSGPGAALNHARNVTRYLQQRNEIERITKSFGTPIDAHATAESFVPWELFVKKDQNTRSAALNDIKSVVLGLPPSKMANLDIDPFFRQHLASNIASHLQENFGVYTVIPAVVDEPILLVFEGDDGKTSNYQVPRVQGVPPATEIQTSQQRLKEAIEHILDIVRQQDEIKEASVEVPLKFHQKLKKFIGEQKKTQSPAEVPARFTVLNTTVTMKGPASTIERFESEINDFVKEQIADEKERGFTLSFLFEEKLGSHLVGKGGSFITQLGNDFDVDVRLADGKVTITGPPAKAEAAKAHIQKLEKQWADETTYVLKIEQKYHGDLIGPQGSQLKKLETRYKVKINFPHSRRQTKDDQSVSGAASVTGGAKGLRRQQADDEVLIKGPSRGADAAREEILSLLQYLKDTGFTATVAIQQGQVKSLIGQGGKSLDELRQTTGAKVDVPSKTDSATPTGLVDVVIKGTKTQVAAAKKAIEEQKATFDNLVKKSVEINKKHRSAIIGPGGSTVRDIWLKAGGSDDRHSIARGINFPRTEADVINVKVEGPREVVEKVVARLQEIVTEREAQVVESVDVPVNQHRMLIGPGGNTKMQLQSELDVTLDIPARNSGMTIVKITGLPSNVAAAKAKIEQLTKVEGGETVQVPRKFHHTVSKDGAWIRQLHREGVKVSHDGHKLPGKISKKQAAAEQLPLITDASEDSDFHIEALAQRDDEGEIPWVLQGDDAAVAKAKTEIAAAIKQAELMSHVGYLTLEDPHLNRHVIGQGGNTVKKIRSQSGCKIDVPKAGESRAAIEIMGSLEGVKKAMDLILKAVADGASRTVNHRRS